MGSLIYLTIIGIQLTSTLVTGSIPLKCVLQNYNLLHIFRGNGDLNSTQIRFDILKMNDIITIDYDSWLFEASHIEIKGLDESVLNDFGRICSAPFVYKTSGYIFSKPISGEGSASVYLMNIQFGFTMSFDIEIVNDQKLMELKGYSYWYDVKDNAEFKFDNLYYGNKELSDSMLSLLNQNWKYLTTQLGKLFTDKIAENIYNNFRNAMLAMPLRDFNNC